MSTLLEQRYRSVLRMLPASYRAHREEEMVDAYLQDFDADEQEWLRPSWREVASVAGLAVRTRMGGPSAPHRYAVAGATVRLFALLSVLLHAAHELTDRALLLAWFGGVGSEDRALYVGSFDSLGALPAVLQWCALILPLCWVAAYAALLRDRRRVALVLSAVAALPGTAFLVRAVLGDPAPSSGQLLATVVFAWLTVLAVGCAFHEDAPPARLPLVPHGLALMAACVLMGGATVTWAYDGAWAGATACVVAGILWYVARGRGATGASDPALPLALALVSFAVLAERAGGWEFELLQPQQGLPAAMVYAAWAQTALLAVVTAALTASGVRLLRRERPGRRGDSPSTARTRPGEGTVRE